MCAAVAAVRAFPESAVEIESAQNQLQCLKDVLWFHLPISKAQSVHAHHHDAKTGKWNEKIRFQSLQSLATASPCTVWEVGANDKAKDSHVLRNMYPNCIFHAFEPVPIYFNRLKARIDASGITNIIPHPYGLGQERLQLVLKKSDLRHEATFLGDVLSLGSKHRSNEMYAQIETFETGLKDSGGAPTLLHINCEGCEWAMIPSAIDAGLVRKIPIIQFSSHNYGRIGIGARVWQYCELRMLLNKTHVQTAGVPFAWERWVRKSGL